MATATVHNLETARKPPKAFYSFLYETHGVLTKVDGIMYFIDDGFTGMITEIEPEMCPFITVLGEVGIADTQRIMDEIHGGLAAIACSRAN